MENQQMAMPAEMAPAGPNPEEMAIYEQMRQQISPQEFSNEMLAGASQVDPQAVAEFTQELQGLDMPPEALDALNDVVDEILANPEQYEQLRGGYIEAGLPEDILPEQFDPQFFAALNMAIDQMIAAPTGVQAFAQGGIAELKPIAKAIASYGRNGDTMLAHITPAEARMLRRRGGSGTINPDTGLPEFFLKKLWKETGGKVLKSVGKQLKSIGKAVKKFAQSSIGRIVLPIALGFFLGPAAAGFLGVSSVAGVAAVSGFVGSAGSTLLAGGNLKDALKAGAIGGLTAGATVGVMGGADSFASGSASTAGMTPGQALSSQVDKFTNVFSPGTAAAPTPGLDAAGQAPVPGAQAGASAPYSDLKMTGTPVKPFPEFFGDQAAAQADPLGSFIQQNDALRTAANTPAALPGASVNATAAQGPLTKAPTYQTPTVGESFSKMGEGLGMGDAPASFDTFKQGATDLFSPGPTNAQITARAQEIMSTTPGASLKDAMAAASKELSPGILRTYGPAAVAGIGAMSAFGGFDSKPVQGGEITNSLMKPVTQRIREGGTQRQMYMQGLPGVVYDDYGAPVYGQSTRLPTYDVPDYNSGGFGSQGQGIMNLPSIYIPPPGTIGSRRVEQPYNNADMYSNLVPRGYADGGTVTDLYRTVLRRDPSSAEIDNWKTQFGDTIDERERAVFRESAGNELAAQRASAAELATQQKAARDAVAQQKALRRSQGSGAMYANINAGLAALAPENNPMDVTDTGFGARNRAAQSAALQQQYAPIFQNQQNAMAEQARILGSKFTPFSPQASGSFPTPASTGPLTVGPAAQVPGTARPPIATQPPITAQPPVTQQPAGYTDQNIRDYLGSNPNMTDAQIRAAMDQFGVNTAQMASATGLPLDQVQQRYDAPSNFSNEAIQSYLAARPGLTDMQIRSAMDEFKVTPAQMAAATGVPLDQVQQRYNTAKGQQFTNEVMTGVPTRLMNMGGIAGLAKGGYPRRNGQISGPGTEKSDSIPAMLSDGEFVMTAKAVRGAGKGNRRAGAKQMYKLMHQLEKNAERG